MSALSPYRRLVAAGLVGVAGVAVWLVLRAGEPERAGLGGAARSAAREARAQAPGSPGSPGEPVPDAEPVRTAVARHPAPPFGLAVRVTARGTARDDAAAGIEVGVGVGPAYDPAAAPLATGRTGVDGSVELVLPWALLAGADGAPVERLWGRVIEPGFAHETRFAEVPERDPGRDPEHSRGAQPSVSLALLARAGTTLRGRLVDAGGAPRAGQVRLVTVTGEGTLRHGRAFPVGSNGWFELPLLEEGPTTLLAEAGEHGTAALRDLDVRFASPPEPVELRLAGEGRLRGRVRDDAGRGSAGLELLAVLAELEEPDPDRAGRRLVEPRTSAVRLEGRGRHWASATTGADGSFDLRGLVAGPYRIYAELEARGRASETLLLTLSPVAADGAPLDLALERPHLVVLVHGPDGSPVEGDVGFDEYAWREPDHAVWPREPWVIVAPELAGAPLDTRLDAPLDAPLDASGARLTGRRTADGRLVYEVEAGRRYQVGLIGGGHPWSPVEAEVPPGGARVDVALRLAPEVATGELAIDVADADGPVRRDLEIRVEDPRDGVPLVWRAGFGRSTWPWRVTLPAGVYRLVVDGAASIGAHGELHAPRDRGRFEREVAVVAGEETPVHAVLPEGARLVVRLAGEADEPEGRRARLLLCAPDGRPEEVLFVREGSAASTLPGRHLERWLYLGDEGTTQALPAGRWTLVATLPDGRTAAAPVTLVDGETAEIILEVEGR